MDRQGDLFQRGDLRLVLDYHVELMKNEVDRWNPDRLLAAAEADVVNYLVSEGTATCPTLLRDRITRVPAREKVETVEDGDGRTRQVRRTRIMISVPFDGDRRVLTLRAADFTPDLPGAELREEEIRLVWTGDGPSIDSQTVRKYLDDQLDQLDEYLARSRALVDQFNTTIRQIVPTLVAARRAKLLADRQMEADIGFPVQQRADATGDAIPARRRKTEAPKPAVVSAPHQPAPVPSDADYEAALAVLHNARNALERMPVVAELDEEPVRDLLVSHLNVRFPGQVGGEMRNGKGKTDILVRVEDRNVLIGECKIWRGRAAVQEALDQLVRKYLVWRDTNAALLLFIHNKDATAAIRNAVAEVEKYPTFRGRGMHGTDERIDFVLHAHGDPAREIRLALLPFVFGLKTG